MRQYLSRCLLILSILFLNSFSWSDMPMKESWMNVFLLGEKIGYYHEIREDSSYQKESTLKLTSEMITKLKRFGLDFEVQQTITVHLGKDLQPRYSLYKENMMGSVKEISTWREQDKMIVQTVVGDLTTRQTRDWESGTQFDASVLAVILKEGLSPGKNHKFNIYSPELGKSFKVTASVGSTQRMSAIGTWFETYPVKLAYEEMPELSTVFYVSKSGDVIKAEVGNYGMAMVRVTEAEAKAIGDRMEVADLSRAKSNVKFEDAEAVTRLKMKIQVKDATLEEMIPTDDRQRILDRTNPQEGTVEINSPPAKLQFPITFPIKGLTPTISIYTNSSPYLEASDMDIKTTAVNVVGNEKNVWEACKKLNSWVYYAVENKGFDTGFASAKQTWQNRKGDCTEHSVLMATLARSLGIPAKVVVGLVSVEDGFYYHMWTEVYVGQWVPLDPTLNETRIDATHIKLAETKSKEDDLGDYAIQLLKTLKKIQIEIIDYDVNGQTHTPEILEQSLDTMNSGELKQLEQLLNEIK